MNVLEQLTAHDAWTTRQLLLHAHELSDTQLDSGFDIGHKTLRHTFDHIIGNMEAWTDLMLGVAQREVDSDLSLSALLQRLERVGPEFAKLVNDLEASQRINEPFTDYLDDPPRQKPYSTAIAHLITHSMHHRAQALYMMKKLGLPNLPEGDVFSWANSR